MVIIRTITSKTTSPAGITGLGTASVSSVYGSKALDISNGDITQFKKYIENAYSNLWICCMDSDSKGTVVGVLKQSDTLFTVFTDADMTGVSNEQFVIVEATLAKSEIKSVTGNTTVDGDWIINSGESKNFSFPTNLLPPYHIAPLIVTPSGTAVITEYYSQL